MVKTLRKQSECQKGLDRRSTKIKMLVVHWPINAKGATTGCLYAPTFANIMYMEDYINGNKKYNFGITKKSKLIPK